jgi:hypothetical protein
MSDKAFVATQYRCDECYLMYTSVRAAEACCDGSYTILQDQHIIRPGDLGKDLSTDLTLFMETGTWEDESYGAESYIDSGQDEDD